MKRWRSLRIWFCTGPLESQDRPCLHEQMASIRDEKFCEKNSTLQIYVPFCIVSCDHGLQYQRKSASFCENRQNRSRPVSSVHRKPVGYSSKNSNFEKKLKKQKLENSYDKSENLSDKPVKSVGLLFSFKI
jgi:hypothetical protein